MIFNGTVSSDGKRIVLANGARLNFLESDCEGPVFAGDAVILDTERNPSIRGAKGTRAWNPVTETKAAVVEEAKRLIQRLAEADEL